MYLAIAREMGDLLNESVALSYLGTIALRCGRLDEAESYLEQAIADDREIGDRQGEGVDLVVIANIFCSVGSLTQQLAIWSKG